MTKRLSPWLLGGSLFLGLGVIELPALAANPTAVTVQPAAVALAGARSQQQLVVTGQDEAGNPRDLTHQGRYFSQAPEVAVVSPAGTITPRGNGAAVIVVRAGGQEVRVAVTVRAMDRPASVDFATEVIPALTRAGCNQGACHGTPSGKNGFRLSLRGYLPDQDHDSLTREVLGRRIDPQHPEESLILRKATGAVPHEGGIRFRPDGHLYHLLRDWVAAGAPPSPSAAPRLVRLEVFPPQRLLEAPHDSQQLAVTAVFGDGSRRDVTALARFSVSDPEAAEVAPDGRVTFLKAGEVTVLAGFLSEIATARLTCLRAVPGFVWKAPAAQNFVDRAVFHKLQVLRIPPSDLCSDAEFVRRVTLDVCGLLPTPDETRRFLADQAPDRRSRLIDRLLERPEYADCWALKWIDRLGCNNRFVGQRGAYSYRQWIWDQVNANVQMDQFVRALLTASGPSYAQPAASFYRRIRDPQSRVEAVAQLFLGVRIGCARCHNHPAERWTQDDYYGLAAFFSRVRYRDGPFFLGKYNKEETVWLDRTGEVLHPRSGRVMVPKLLGGPEVAVADDHDRRAALAAWVTAPDNPYFARVAVNRLWYHLMGRGIVEPVDDFRESNPPCNPELLDALAADFVAHQFDVKHTLRTILNSATYQLSSTANRLNEQDATYCSHYRVRQLPAEQLLDAICQVTGVPERFKGVVLGTRASQLPDGELLHPFLKAFGRPARAIECECERESDATLEQALLLEGGRLIQDRLRSDEGLPARLAASTLTPEALADELFLATLCRQPSAKERRLVAGRLAVDRRRGLEDVLWALLNHREFLFQH
jgi:hypothetical protein